jgi:hypothetical protein
MQKGDIDDLADSVKSNSVASRLLFKDCSGPRWRRMGLPKKKTESRLSKESDYPTGWHCKYHVAEK